MSWRAAGAVEGAFFGRKTLLAGILDFAYIWCPLHVAAALLKPSLCYFYGCDMESSLFLDFWDGVKYHKWTFTGNKKFL